MSEFRNSNYYNTILIVTSVLKDMKRMEMKVLEQNTTDQWDNTTRYNVSKLPQQTEPEEIITKTILFTWLPWFETTTTKEGQNDIFLKTRELSKFQQAIGVGSWREITLYGNKIKPITNEIPETSALCVSSALSLTTSIFNMFFIVFLYFTFL
ncbi:uncharacterized protein NPIL_393631 [Nephila pilipes]|uniref:Uncharacterized protein n=1 Tax=Nephila pilipes TaxID=299642 RepID=A0A8X6N2Q8_NEPPI|nr:uncharacterized protein NPIL_393631 [Nephila pilipes]